MTRIETTFPEFKTFATGTAPFNLAVHEWANPRHPLNGAETILHLMGVLYFDKTAKNAEDTKKRQLAAGSNLCVLCVLCGSKRRPNVEAAELLGISERTAKRTWAYARAWLFEELSRKA